MHKENLSPVLYYKYNRIKGHILSLDKKRLNFYKTIKDENFVKEFSPKLRDVILDMFCIEHLIVMITKYSSFFTIVNFFLLFFCFFFNFLRE